MINSRLLNKMTYSRKEFFRLFLFKNFLNKIHHFARTKMIKKYRSKFVKNNPLSFIMVYRTVELCNKALNCLEKTSRVIEKIHFSSLLSNIIIKKDG